MIHVHATHTPDWKPLVDLVKPLWQEYADRHGYKLTLACAESHTPGCHYSFTKTYFTSQYLKHGAADADFVFVIDLDMIPTNMAYVLEDTVAQKGPSPSCGVVMGKDINGWNSGAYFITPQDWQPRWLDTVFALRGITTSEQHAMWLINEAFGVAETKTVNSIPYEAYKGFDFQKKDHYSQWEPSHFICHLPGMTMAERLRIFPQYIPQIIR